MLERNTTLPSPQALDEHEELAWFAQQQQPEQLHRQLGAWRLGPTADLSLLALAVQAVVEATPGLNSRYHFSDDGDLYKTQELGWYPCLRIERSTAEGMDALLRARQAAPWDSTMQPPFEALLLAGDHQAALGLLCHAVLRQSPQTLLERIRAAYDAQAGDQPLVLEPLSQAPSTDIAQRILEAFRQALAEPGMTLDDDFFDMGGHSLLATRIIGRLQGEHGIELRFSDFFASPSASALATRAKLSQGQASQASDQARDIQQAPMALAQASLWRACAAFDYGTIFNLPFALDFHDLVDEALLQQAFTDLLERHASLRTTYHGEGDDACQRIVPLARLGRFKWFWNSAESAGASLASEAKHRFDLARELPPGCACCVTRTVATRYCHSWSTTWPSTVVAERDHGRTGRGLPGPRPGPGAAMARCGAHLPRIRPGPECPGPEPAPPGVLDRAAARRHSRPRPARLR